MGTLRSQVNLTGQTINNVLLGEPVVPVRADGTPAEPGDSMLDLYWAWDNAALPTGKAEIVNGELIITPDQEEDV